MPDTSVSLVGHSTGGGEVARYIGRRGTKRVGLNADLLSFLETTVV